MNNTLQPETITIGLDVGNFDVKTQNTQIASGFEVTDTLPFGVKEYLKYHGRYYLPSDERFAYEKDKTKNEGCFILSLMAIAREILWNAKNDHPEQQSSAADYESVQNYISSIKTVNLGVGLPPTHVSTLSESLIAYYKERFAGGVEYEYGKYLFKFELGRIECFAPSFAALVCYAPDDDDSAIKYPSFYGVDIGGWTVDVITILNKNVQVSKCDSKPRGVLAMYDSIIREIEVKFGKRLTRNDIEIYLRGAKNLLSDEIKAGIDSLVRAWYDSVIRELRQFGVETELHPVIFLGGGSRLFKKYITADIGKVFAKAEIIEDPNANAKAYAMLMEKINGNRN